MLFYFMFRILYIKLFFIYLWQLKLTLNFHLYICVLLIKVYISKGLSF